MILSNVQYTLLWHDFLHCRLPAAPVITMIPGAPIFLGLMGLCSKMFGLGLMIYFVSQVAGRQTSVQARKPWVAKCFHRLHCFHPYFVMTVDGILATSAGRQSLLTTEIDQKIECVVHSRARAGRPLSDLCARENAKWARTSLKTPRI